MSRVIFKVVVMKSLFKDNSQNNFNFCLSWKEKVEISTEYFLGFKMKIDFQVSFDFFFLLCEVVIDTPKSREVNKSRIKLPLSCSRTSELERLSNF